MAVHPGYVLTTTRRDGNPADGCSRRVLPVKHCRRCDHQPVWGGCTLAVEQPAGGCRSAGFQPVASVVGGDCRQPDRRAVYGRFRSWVQHVYRHAARRARDELAARRVWRWFDCQPAAGHDAAGSRVGVALGLRDGRCAVPAAQHCHLPDAQAVAVQAGNGRR